MASAAEEPQSLALAFFLWQRIRQLGVQSIMGVPGDMNLELLDYIDDVEGLNWVGNANELNAAYAADGYCRVKGTPGVLVTTMGVGELSALNGVAGAYTEQVKLIHVVGTTATETQEKRAMIHHSLGSNPDHRVYDKISTHVRATHCWLDNIATAPHEIDRVLRECYLQSLPVYIFVPMDFVHTCIPASFLDRPVDLLPKVDTTSFEAAAQTVLSRLHAAKAPTIVVDALVARFGATTVARQLVDLIQIPTFSTPMGKSIVDESRSYYYGVYNGSVSHPGIASSIEEKSDLVLDLGPCLSDSNTGGHSRNIKEKNYISVAATHVTAGNKTYDGVPLVHFLTSLVEALQSHPLAPVPSLQLPPEVVPTDLEAEHITQSWIWRRIGKMVRPGDILLAESGTAQFGFSDAVFPTQVQYLTQIYFGSIGYSVPACFGAALAQKESGSAGRTILVVGDGSLQLTVQEIGTMIKLGMKNVIIIVINNGGYTIERAIHGAEKAYNDIATWDHQLLLSVFGLKDGRVNSQRVASKAAFEEVINSPTYTDLQSIQVLEVMMEKMDLPWRLKAQIDLINVRNAAAMAIAPPVS
ncbi:pyruvate decarboxylase [Cadophora sp. DSE1049]|nr:pyruvate decarboxylase [Cadophora sp. DSE1049]